MIELGLLSWGLCIAAGAVADTHMGLRSWILLGGADAGFGVPKGVLRTWWPWGEVVSGLGRGIFTWVCQHRGWVGAGGMLESPCCRLSLWQGRCQDGAGGGWHAVERHGGDKNIPASSQGAFPPLFLQPMLLQKSKSHHQFLEQLGVPVAPQHLNQVTRGKLSPFPFPLFLSLSLFISFFSFIFFFFFIPTLQLRELLEGVSSGLCLAGCFLSR